MTCKFDWRVRVARRGCSCECGVDQRGNLPVSLWGSFGALSRSTASRLRSQSVVWRGVAPALRKQLPSIRGKLRVQGAPTRIGVVGVSCLGEQETDVVSDFGT